MASRNARRLLLTAVGVTALVAAGGLVMQSGHRPRGDVPICSDPGVFQIELRLPFQEMGGHMYLGSVASDSMPTPIILKNALFGNVRLGRPDTESAPTRSTAVLCEDERQLGPAHASVPDIRTNGAGRFLHTSVGIMFATSDNSDPNVNGRRYRALEP